MAKHDDLDREVCFTAAYEPEQLEDTADPAEEREGHCLMLGAVAPAVANHRGVQQRMTLSARTGKSWAVRKAIRARTVTAALPGE